MPEITADPKTIEEYLQRLRDELAGSDPALTQDALYDAEEYLRQATAGDLLASSWEAARGSPRLWLRRTPRGVAASGAPVSASDALRPFAERIFGRRGRAARRETAELFGLLEASDASWRRPEAWVALAYRLFFELADERAAEARVRTSGSLRADWRTPNERARIEKARAILHGRSVRVFSPLARGDSLEPGAAVGVPGHDPLASVRALRAAHPPE